MKHDYVLLKRSKVDVERFAFVYDDAVLSCTTGQLFRAMQAALQTNKIPDVDIVWRNGTRTAEELHVVEKSHFTRFDILEYEYSVCLPMRAQGLPAEFSVPVNVRSLYDDKESFISEIHVPAEFANAVRSEVARCHAARGCDEDDSDAWDEEDVVDCDDDEDDDDFGFRPEDQRKQLGDFNYRSPDWVVTLTDEQVYQVQHLEVGVDPDIELPRADDAKEEFF